MLVLSRRKNEAIVIKGRIKVTVLEIKGGRVRIGIEAPPKVAVRRGELLPQSVRRDLAVA